MIFAIPNNSATRHSQASLQKKLQLFRNSSIDINLHPFSHIIFAPDLTTKQNKIMITTIFLILVPLMISSMIIIPLSESPKSLLSLPCGEGRGGASVIGKSFQLAASSKAAFVPASSKARGPHHQFSLPERDSSRSPQSTPPESLNSSPCGEVRRGFILLYSQLSCRKPPTTRPADLFIECPNQRPINHRCPLPRRRSNPGRKPLSGHDQSGSIAILRSLSLPWSAP